jgi:aldehyde:ferredoxin oxidoreductase
LVRFSAVISGHHASARCGIGAVMGSKKLKAIALTDIPKAKFSVAEPKVFEEAVKEAHHALPQHPMVKALNDLGTSFTLTLNNALGMLPTRNFQEGVFEHAERISGERLKQEFRVRKTDSCYICPIRCESEVRVTSGEYAGANTHGPEYETAAGFGSNLGIWNAEFIMEANWHCDNYGIDTITTAGIMAFLMECFQRGYLQKEDGEGLVLCWGDEPSSLEFIHRLAHGSIDMARAAGKGIEELVNWVCARYDARASRNGWLSRRRLPGAGRPGDLSCWLPAFWECWSGLPGRY